MRNGNKLTDVFFMQKLDQLQKLIYPVV